MRLQPRLSEKGFSLIEIVSAIAILAVLAALLFPVFVNAKERGHQARCISRLRQIYSALQMYSADNPSFEPVHANVAFPDSAMSDPRCLIPYLGSAEMLYCPETPECAKARIASTYVWTAMPPRDSPLYATALRQMDVWFSEPNSGFPLVHCLVHDELHFYPAERSFSEALNSPFVIRLQVDGSVKMGRFQIVRGHDIAKLCR